MAKPDLFENQRLALKRHSVLIKGNPVFSRAGRCIVCIEDGKVIHHETFYADNGNAARRDALRYQKRFNQGLSLGLENPLHRFSSLPHRFDTTVNRAIIESALRDAPKPG